MTDRVDAVLVTFEEPIRVDSEGLEAIEHVLHMLNGVVDVRRVPHDGTFDIAAMRRDSAWKESLLKLVRKGPPE